MALVSVPFTLGDQYIVGAVAMNGAGGNATLALNATNVKQAMAFCPPYDVTPDVVGFEIAAVTTAQDVRVQIYSLDQITGDPTTAVGSAGTLASASVTAGWHEVSGLNAALTAGQPYALVFDWPGTVGDITLRVYSAAGGTRPNVRSTWGQAYTTAWQAKSTGTFPCFYLETAAGVAIPVWGTAAFRSWTSASLAAAGTTEIALRFKAPFRGECVGCFAYHGNAAGDWRIKTKLYSDAGTLLSDGYAVDEDQSAENGFSAGYLFLSTPITVEIDSWYKLSLQQTQGSGNEAVFHMLYDAAKHLDGDPMGGQNFHYQEYSSGAWQAAVATQRPAIFPVFRSIDTAAGGGGLAHIIGG